MQSEYSHEEVSEKSHKWQITFNISGQYPSKVFRSWSKKKKKPDRKPVSTERKLKSYDNMWSGVGFWTKVKTALAKLSKFCKRSIDLMGGQTKASCSPIFMIQNF